MSFRAAFSQDYTVATLPPPTGLNAYRWAFVSDDDGGTLYKSNGASWVQIAKGVSEGGGGGGTGGVGVSMETPAGTVNGTNVTFTLSAAPNPPGDLLLFRNGLSLTQGDDYTLSGATITFLTAPATGSKLLAGVPYNVITDAFNVKTFGAAGDGSTDDTTAIQAALTAANAAGGGRVYLPPGIYIISSLLTIYAETILQGDGQFVSEIRSANHGSGTITGGGLIHGQNLTHVQIRDLSLRGVSKTGTSCYGIYLQWTTGPALSHITIENVRVYDLAGDGVKIDVPIMTRLNNVRVVNATGDGISLNNGTSTVLEACYVGAADKAGYLLDTMVYNSLIACASENNGLNYYLKTTSNTVLIGCGCETSRDLGSTYNGTHYLVEGGTCNQLLSCYGREFGTPGADSNYYLDFNGGTLHRVYGFRGVFSTNAPTGQYTIRGSAQVTFDSCTFTGGTAGPTTQTVSVTAGTTTTFALNRASTSNFVNFTYRTSGVDRWTLGLRNDTTDDFHFRDNVNGRTQIICKQATNRVGFAGVTSPTSTIHFGGSVALPFVNKTADYTVLETDSFMTVDSTGGNVTLTLPTANGCPGREYTFKRVSGGANTVTIAAAASETIEGSATYALSALNAFVKLISNGTSNWHIVAK